MTEALERVDAAEAGPGEIIAVAGIAEVTIGETLADPEDPRPLPVITVDEPSLSITIGINTSPMAGRRAPSSPRASCATASTRELIGNVSLRVVAHRRRGLGLLGGAGPRRAAAGGAGRDHAPRGLRADGRAAAGAGCADRRQAPRAVRAAVDRRARGVRRRRHADAGAAQGPHGAHDQPRHRLGADGLPRPRPRVDRLPHGVHHRDARHGPDAPRVRPLGDVGGGDAHARLGRAGRRPPPARPSSYCADEPPGARHACSSAPARRSTRA